MKVLLSLAELRGVYIVDVVGKSVWWNDGALRISKSDVSKNAEPITCRRLAFWSKHHVQVLFLTCSWFQRSSDE